MSNAGESFESPVEVARQVSSTAPMVAMEAFLVW
jgi:hypothetical protein